MEIRLFGPLEVVLDPSGAPVELGAPKQRAVLAMLALEPGRVVSLDRLIDELWAGEAPSSATGTLQAYVSHLRRVLEPNRRPRQPPTALLTREPGYLLAVPPGQIDLFRFAAWAADGNRALGRREYDQALRVLQDALALWRGEPLAEFAEQNFAVPTIARLTELHANAEEDRAEAALATGSAAAEIADLERLVDTHPYRERMRGLLALALYRAGRQTDALATLRAARAALDELGLSPGPELRRLEHAVLNQAPELDAPTMPAPEVAPTRVFPVVAVAADTDRLVGRDAQLARIGARLDELRAGRGGVLLISGEAGIGKSRLAKAATTEATARGMAAAWGRCVDTTTAPAFWPWLEALRELGEPGAHAVRLLSGAAPDQDEFFELQQSAVAALAETGPVVVVIDDVHWADVASLRLLGFAAAQLERRPVLIVVTLRPEPGEHPEQLRDALAALAREPGTEWLELAPLTLDDVADYLRLRRGDEGLAVPLHERSGGNPFYLVELARLAESEHGLSSAVPRGARDVIGRRLARLPSQSRSLLEIAAVAGRDVNPDLLESVAQRAVDEVLSDLEPAVVTGLLVEAGDDYRFAHALVRDTLYAGLDRLTAARLHLRVGTWLESTSAPDDDPAREADLAHHFSKAIRVGGRARAMEHATRAASAATRQRAYDEAVRFWELALPCVGPDDDAARCSIQIELGRALRAVGAADRANLELERAILLAERISDHGALLTAASVIGGQSPWIWRPYGVVDQRMVDRLEGLLTEELTDHDRAALLGTLGVELIYGPRRPDGERLAAEGVELARRTGDPELIATTLNNYYLAAWAPGRDKERLAAASEILALPHLPRVTELIARVLRMACLLPIGDLTGWDRDLARCERLLTEIGRPELEPMVRLAKAGRHTLAGDWDAAEALGQRFAPVRYGSSQWGAQFPRLITTYGYLLGQGRVGELIDELLVAAEDPDLVPLRPVAVLAALDVGQEELARQLIRRWGSEIRDDWTAGFLLPVWGFIAARLGEPDPGPLYNRLLPFAEQLIVCGMGMLGWGCHHMVLAELAHRLGSTERAREHARRAVHLHQRLGLTYWQTRAEKLLASFA